MFDTKQITLVLRMYLMLSIVCVSIFQHIAVLSIYRNGILNFRYFRVLYQCLMSVVKKYLDVIPQVSDALPLLIIFLYIRCLISYHSRCFI